MGTSTRQEHEQRSRDLADSLRNFLVAVNTGGIGAMLITAGALAEQKINPSWTLWPSVLFIVGLLMTGWSIFAAQHRAEIRLKGSKAYAEEVADYPPLTFPWWWQSAPWNIVALTAFASGALLAILTLSCIRFG